ncbi:MAG: sulfite exporter TauE/SafE family protein [Marinifilaceae bacterium]|jgi:uncharacterized membrane protein YfcA|nr:sulfite exporter TauE/SafE family protein [Marinifilaceae bacterium]
MIDIWVIIIIIIASLVKGVTGFGFALLSFPLLLNWYSPKEIIPVLMICNFIASFFIVIQKKDKKLLNVKSYILIISASVFTILGVFILHKIEAAIIIKLSAVLFLILSIYSLHRREASKVNPSNFIFLSVGAFVGILTGTISVSGPPLAFFLNKLSIDNRTFREIFAAFSIVTATIAIIAYHQTGMLTSKSIELSAVFSPILLVGTFVGKAINKKLSMGNFYIVNSLLTIMASILLLF